VINVMKGWSQKDPREKTFMVAGMLFLALAVVGVFVPVVPQVPFAIVAAYFFSKGSARVHQWIRENKYFGKPVKNWEDHRAIRPKMKAISVIAMVAGGIFAGFKLDLAWTIVVGVAFAAAIVFVLTRKSNPSGPKIKKSPDPKHKHRVAG
jgi:uncharacterized membrane protein YbaN (DUF454 family)